MALSYEMHLRLFGWQVYMYEVLREPICPVLQFRFHKGAR